MNSNAKKIFQITGFSLFFILIVAFAFFGAKDIIFGVKIKNVNLVDGSTVTSDTVDLTGTARNAINLTLNGREISVDQKGNFNETIALLPGYNIINIKAKDKFGYIDEKNYKLMH
jgi:hypothetical protein